MEKRAHEIKNPLSRKLLLWYRRRARRLPWRETNDPYGIWISEIMLQQTQVDTVIPYYQRFLKQFPDVRALASAPEEKVLKAWENLGYYSRARHLRAAAQKIVCEFGGRVPDAPEDIKTLPGIGPYSAGAILSIAYGKSLPAVDGNVRRILSRLFAVRRPLNDLQGQKKLYNLAALLVPAKNPGDYNQALMDLGATLCRPQSPNCRCCPIVSLCLAHASGMQDMLPVKSKTPAIPLRRAAAAVIHDGGGNLLVVQRPSSGLLASFWKLPGGFVDGADGMEAGLKERIKEELGISIRVGKPLACVDHAYTHFRLTLCAFQCRSCKGVPQALACQDWRFATPADLQKLPLSKIDRMILKSIKPAGRIRG